MLEIKPVESKEEQRLLCEKCALVYDPLLFAYKAFESGELIAAAQFDITGKDAVLCGIRKVIGSSDDFEAMFILGRAVLNFLDLCGAETVSFRAENEYDLKIAKLIGFKEKDGIMKIELKGLFDTPCQHGNSYKETGEGL